jgi:hypothetical protein
MTRLPYSEDLYQLLHRVADHLVVLHSECEVHVPGWSWKQSDMSEQFQELCTDARHAGLIDLGLHQPWGSPAFLTQSGVERLEELYRRHMSEVRGVTA